MIKNIVFDLGGVIIKGKASTVLDKFNISDELKNKIANTYLSDQKNIDLGYETLEEHLDSSNLDIDLELRNKLLTYYKYRDFNEEVISLIKLLKEKGYKIYIFSDNNIGVYKYLKSLDKFSDIDGWVISCEYHLVKEDKRFFEALFNTYNLNPSECFFIDNLEENIKMSKSLGMDGHVLDYENYGIEKLVEDLRNRGIL